MTLNYVDGGGSGPRDVETTDDVRVCGRGVFCRRRVVSGKDDVSGTRTRVRMDLETFGGRVTSGLMHWETSGPTDVLGRLISGYVDGGEWT